MYTILTKHKEIRTDPEPSMTLLDFDHGTMNFELIFWVSEPSCKKAVTSALNLAIWEELGRLGYQFATPSGRLSKPQRSGMTTPDLIDVDEENEKLRDGLEIISGE
jgi:small-conductance mechanosensitive channel